MSPHLAPIVRTPPQHVKMLKADDKRQLLLDFCRWLEKDEFGEGHEEEIVDHYLKEHHHG